MAVTVDLLDTEYSHGPFLNMARNVIITANGNTDDFIGTSDLGIDELAELIVSGYITGTKGTLPTLTLYVEERTGPSDSYNIVATYNITGNGQLVTKKIVAPKKRLRLRWVVGGTNPRFVLANFLATLELGGGSGLGVWSNYVDRASNRGLSGITIGNGILIDRWWTPGPVAVDVGSDPFLFSMHVSFKLGSTSSVNGTLSVRMPQLIDAIVPNIDIYSVVADSTDGFFPGLAIARDSSAGTNFPGLVSLADEIISLDGTPWDATHPFTWAISDELIFASTIQAFYTLD